MKVEPICDIKNLTVFNRIFTVYFLCQEILAFVQKTKGTFLTPDIAYYCIFFDNEIFRKS